MAAVLKFISHRGLFTDGHVLQVFCQTNLKDGTIYNLNSFLISCPIKL